MSVWSDAVAALSPYIWYAFDETSGNTAYDSSGNGRDGTAPATGLNQPKLVPGSSGTAITLGEGAGASTGAGRSIPSVGATFAVTYKGTSTTTGAGLFLAPTGTTMTLDLATTNPRVWISGTRYTFAGYLTSALLDDVTHFIVLVIRSTVAELWVDGVMVSSVAHTKTSTASPSMALKGSNYPTGTYDEWLIFTTALSSSDIAALQNAWAGSAPGTPTVTAAASGSGLASAASLAVGVVAAAAAGAGLASAAVVPVSLVDAAASGSGVASAVVEVVGEPPSVTADATGTGTASATVEVVIGVNADAAGSGVASAVVEVVGGAGSLADYVDINTTTSLDGSGHLVAATPGAEFFYVLPGIVFNPGTEYDVTVTYTNGVGDSWINLYSALGPTQTDVNASQWLTFAEHMEGVTGIGSVPAGTFGTSGSHTFRIGPGIRDHDAAMAAGEQYGTWQMKGLDVVDITVAAVPVPPAGTDLTRSGGRTRTGYAVATWEPPVVQPPAETAGSPAPVIRGEAFGAVTMVGTQPAYTVSAAVAPRARTRILVGGKDVSFFRGVPTPEPEYQLAEPLLWGPSSLEFPQIAAAFETLGTGDLSWCAKGKPVVYQRVREDGTILGVDYRGLVIAHDTSGKTARLEVGGHGQGRATLRHKPGPIFRDTLDLGRLAWAAIRDLGLRFEPRMGPETGIESATFGNQSYLDHIAELCAKAWQRNGTQWTLMPDSSATYGFAPKDTTTIHWTVFNDDARSVAALRSDLAEEPNRIFMSGVTPKGQRVRNGVYPGLTPGPAAPYPFADDRTFDQGTTDADTDTGDGITVMVRRLWVTRYLSLEEADGTFGGKAAKAIAALQRDAGLTGPVGVMTPALWRALFDLDVTGYTIRGAQVVPIEDDKVRRWNRSSSGQPIQRNPDFDRSVEWVDRPIDFGPGFTAEQMRDWSWAEIDRGVAWTGTVTLHGGAVLIGDIPVGATIDATDLADVRSIRPGHNVRLPMFAGGIVVHVSGVEINRAEDGRPVAVLTADTQARDAMEVWEIIRRNRETRRDPARRWKGNRASGEIKDSIVEWDEIGGVLDGDRELKPGWNRVRVVGGQEGTVARIKTLVTAAGTDNGIEYAVAVFGKPMTAPRLDTLVPAPLGVAGDKKWRDNSETLDRLGALYSAGTEVEPCGYSRGKKADGANLTGFHIDDASFSYRCGPDHLLDVLVWVGQAATLRGGRIMRNQLEAGA